jgi:hypothetical protein
LLPSAFTHQQNPVDGLHCWILNAPSASQEVTKHPIRSPHISVSFALFFVHGVSGRTCVVGTALDPTAFVVLVSINKSLFTETQSYFFYVFSGQLWCTSCTHVLN